jgi:hypothetical protein
MAILSKTGITTGESVEAWHVTQSIDAFSGLEAYDITLSGSFNMTGPITGEPGVINDLTASYAMNALSASYAPGGTNTNFANTDLTFTGGRTHYTDNNFLWITSNTSSTSLGQYLYFQQPASIMGIGVTQSYFGIDGNVLSFYKSTSGNQFCEIDINNISAFSAYTTITIFNDGFSARDFQVKGTLESMIYVNAIDNRLGIGKDNPAFTLDISGSTVITGSLILSPNYDLTIASGSIILKSTASAAPSWTGTDGEIVPATVGGQYFLYMWMNGAWRSGSFV